VGTRTSLVLEAGAGPAGDSSFDGAAWASPHLVCEATPIASAGRLVVLISIDTLRADHLDLYGYDRPTSPRLGALATDALVFDRAFAPSPYTLPSHATMLSGLAPESHRAGFDFPEAPMPEEILTLAEMLDRAGFRTVGFTAGGLMGREFGFAQGFDEWHQYQRGNLPSVLPAVYDALGDDGGSTFLFLHTYDVHGPYQQPPGQRYFMGAGGDGPPRVEADDAAWQEILATPYHKYLELDRFSGAGEVVDAYDSGIRFVDSQLGELFDFLQQAGQYDGAVVVVTSDHGESLYDRQRYFGHSHSLTDQELRVPLIVKLPGSAAVGRRSELVELTDLVPMILRQAGVHMAVELDGRSPLEDVEPRATVRGASSHLGSVWIRSPDWKVVSEASPSWKKKRLKIFGDVGERFPVAIQLYSLQEDPLELHDLVGLRDTYPDEVRELVSTLRSLEKPGRDSGLEREMDAATVHNLRALGYLQ
jgi:arylsulfatase A-like enzyme